MKKISLYSLIHLYSLLFVLASCTKNQEFDGTRVDERLATHLSQYEELLASAEYGWLGYLFPQAGRAYTFHLEFTNDNRVRMTATLNPISASMTKESSYRLRATQVPSLYFDTYNYIHALADPDPDVSGGPPGEGHISDFEFSILSVSQDTLKLRGNHNNCDMLLIRASESQSQGYVRDAFDYNQHLGKLNNMPYYYNRLTIGDKDFGIVFNTQRQTITIYSDDVDAPPFNTTYATLNNGIWLRKPYENEGVLIKEISNFEIDLKGRIKVRIGNTIADIINEGQPFAVDLNAARSLYAASRTYRSITGFTINGIVDGLGLSSIPGFMEIQYRPRQFVDGYDGLTLYFANGMASYISALNTHLEPDGRMVLTYVGWIGSLPGGLYDEVIFQNNEFLFDPRGFYVYRTAGNSYDLVSVSDARRWIRFY